MAGDLQVLSAPNQAALAQQLNTTFNLHRTTRLGVVQRKYDSDTNHSQNTAQQSRWDAAIRSALSTKASSILGQPL